MLIPRRWRPYRGYWVLTCAVVLGLLLKGLLWPGNKWRYLAGSDDTLRQHRRGHSRLSDVIRANAQFESQLAGKTHYVPYKDLSQYRDNQRPQCDIKLRPKTSPYGLLDQMSRAPEWNWLRDRIERLWPDWTNSTRVLFAKGGIDLFKQQRILVYPGVLLATNFAKPSSYASGGPLGELLQWSDLLAGLYALGHNVTLLESPRDVAGRLAEVRQRAGSDSCIPENYDLIYLDYLAYNQLPQDIKDSFRCRMRILDVYGTEAMYNDPDYAYLHGYRSPAGAAGLRLKQFLTFYPMTPDNTFLGFIVQPRSRTESLAKEHVAVLYGKDSRYLRERQSYIRTLQKEITVHHTMTDVDLPGLVGSGVLSSYDYGHLLDKAKYLVGLGDPIEGTGVMEALAHGCVFLNPRFRGKRQDVLYKNKKPTTRKVTSQVPYLEQYVGPPHVYTVDPEDAQEIIRVLSKTRNATFAPYTPYEFQMEGYLQRLAVHVERQDFCSRSPDNGTSWMPRATLQLLVGADSVSCVDTCRGNGLVCEPDFFPSINSVESFKNLNQSCPFVASDDDVYQPSKTGGETPTCVLQGAETLFSCAGGQAGLQRLCPCRHYRGQQVALCRECT